jgi:hypothetical protein
MPHRYVCEVLDEIRTAVKVGRIDMINGLVEEAQTLVNRMEAKLHDYSDLGYRLDTASDLRKKLRDLEKQANMIEDSLDGME